MLAPVLDSGEVDHFHANEISGAHNRDTLLTG
jgi:hypothetical protein